MNFMKYGTVLTEGWEKKVIPMDKLEFWLGVLRELAPIIIAVITIIPTIRSNRKKTQESIDQVQKTLEAHIREDEDDKARTRRYRILRFYDEMCSGAQHSESHFEDILDDIDKYELYCATHKDFRNNRGTVAMKYITETYYRLKASGGFLKEIEHEAS